MALIQLELVPFDVPDAVVIKTPPGRRQDGLRQAPIVELKDLSAQALDELCDQFRTSIFKIAGKDDPRIDWGPGGNRC